MLVLGRKINEGVKIGDNVVVSVNGIRGDKVSLAFDAPKNVPIVRTEISRETSPGKIAQLRQEGWSFSYCPETKWICASHENGRGQFSVCEVDGVSQFNGGNEYFGYAIAEFLNTCEDPAVDPPQAVE